MINRPPHKIRHERELTDKSTNDRHARLADDKFVNDTRVHPDLIKEIPTIVRETRVRKALALENQAFDFRPTTLKTNKAVFIAHPDRELFLDLIRVHDRRGCLFQVDVCVSQLKSSKHSFSFFVASLTE
jgi:hypothetical protein